MRIFHETSNKYYELISYLIQKSDGFSDDELTGYLQDYLNGEIDFSMINLLFSKEDENSIAFCYKDGRYRPALNKKFPIRNSKIENQALSTLSDSVYAKDFLSETTRSKLEQCKTYISDEWNPKDIEIKNQFKNEENVAYKEGQLGLIAEAISKKCAIIYDNVKENIYAYKDAYAFPVKIEYSFINDKYRICVFEPNENRFLKMNFSTMNHIRICEDEVRDLDEKYKCFFDDNSKKIVLEVEPIGHVIERCFRIFSYYDREAVYDKEEQKYRLEISYYRFDESELIRDILSMGSYAVVVAPKELQVKVYQRIKAATKRYLG